MSWRLGLASGVCLHRPLTQILSALADSGAQGIEVGTPPGHFHPEVAAEVESVRDELGRLSLEAVSVHAPFGRAMDLAATSPDVRARGVTAVNASTTAIRRLGGQLVVVHPSDLERHGEDVEARLWAALDSLQRIAEHAKSLGVTVALETPLPHLIGGHPEEFRWLITRLPHEVRVCLDSGHAALGRNWREFIDIADGRLAHVHASDNRGVFDDHLPPGDGTIDWREIARTLADVDFRGWIMLELHGPPDNPGTLLTRALDQAARVLLRG